MSVTHMVQLSQSPVPQQLSCACRGGTWVPGWDERLECRQWGSMACWCLLLWDFADDPLAPLAAVTVDCCM